MEATPAIDAQIQAHLDQIEREQDVRILFAVESGSRAWGFASPDSDYDVRFIYTRGLRDYVRVQPLRDVIELPLTDVLDINGWDILKTLGQFQRSNPALLEWLRSPIVYHTYGDFAAKLRELSETYYSPRRMTYHYISMAKSNYRLAIENKTEVSLKKYLYVLRPLACARWLEQNLAPPPTCIHDVLAGIELPLVIRERLEDLMRRKQRVMEIGSAAPDTELNAFVDAELARLGEIVAGLPDERIPEDLLNRLLWLELAL